MLIRPIATVLFLLYGCSQVNAQLLVKGKIYDAETDSVIVAVNVYNINTKQSARSGNDGNYAIAAAEGERLVFSITGFKPDTVTVMYHMLVIPYDVTLRKQVVTLRNVTVTSSYYADSIARRNYYSHIYEKQPGLTGRNTPSNGFGISLSPFSYFSHNAKEKRKLKKQLIRQEEEDYIDRYFPVEMVARLTGLRGDSLSRFMALYRPTYSFCRKNSREKMLLYINEKFKEFKKP